MNLRKKAFNNRSFDKLHDNFGSQTFHKKRHNYLPSIHRTPLSSELRIAALRDRLKHFPLLPKEIGIVKCRAKFRKSTREERHLQNFYLQLVRKVHGKSAESRRYLNKRKAKRHALHARIESHAASFSAQASRDWEREAQEGSPVVFSDEEDEFLTTTTDFDTENEWGEDTDEDEPHARWTRHLRGFVALMIPIMVSGGLGAYLAYLHGQKPPQAWFWGDKEDPNAPPVLKKNELKGRCKAMQYPANEPC